MLGPNLILTLFIAASAAVNRVKADIDVENVLRTLQQLHQQQKHQQNEQIVQFKEKNYDRRDVDDNKSRFGSLRAKEVETLIEKALNDDDVVLNKKTSRLYFKRPNKQKVIAIENVDLYALLKAINNEQDYNDGDDRPDEKVIIQNAPERQKMNKETKYSQYYTDQINKLLPNSYGVRQKYASKKKRLQLSDLLDDTVYSEVVNSSDPTDLSDYSKVYVILNLDAIQQSSMRNRLTDLVYSLLQSPTSGQTDHSDHRDLLYKGFHVNDDFRRGGKGRSSGEVYSKDPSKEYKPKRLRSHDSNVGGRTPIPYIRHRGDI